MTWSVELAESAARDLRKLDSQHQKRIVKFLQGVAKLDNPRSLDQALHGSQLGEFWKYRVGDYRLICRIENDRPVVLVLRLGHRREIYTLASRKGK